MVERCPPTPVHRERLAQARGAQQELEVRGPLARLLPTGPHKLRESLPLILILRNRLKYALTKAEANAICMQKFVKVDGKVRTDLNYPAGFMGEYREAPLSSHPIARFSGEK